MSKKQFFTLEATLVVIMALLCVELFSNNQLMKKISSSTETTVAVKQMEEKVEKVEMTTNMAEVEKEEDKTEEVVVPVPEDDSVTINNTTNTFSRYPGATSWESIIDQIKPLKGDTYRERQNNFERMDIFVQEEVVINSSSGCFPGKTVDISIYDGDSIITILDEEREEEQVQLLWPYNLYRRGDMIVLEGIDVKTRKYYEYTYSIRDEEWYVYGGENVDVPDEEKDFIFLTFYNGTYTLKGGNLTFWKFLSKEATGEIPEPAQPQNVKLCKLVYGYTVDTNGYNGIPYIDKNGNIINLIITTEVEDWNYANPDTKITGIDYTIIASNVKRIIDPNNNYLHAYIVYQSESEDYQLAVINTEGNLEKTIDLNEKTVSKIYLYSWVSGSSGGDCWITYIEVNYDVEGYGTISHLFYELENKILIGNDTEHLEYLLEGEFTVSEFKERSQEVIQEIKKIQ